MYELELENEVKETAPEVKLWQAVISQAMQDAIRFNDSFENIRAMHFVESGSERLKMACEYADVDEKRLVQNMKKLVIYIARSIARGSQPKLFKGHVRWVKPLQHVRKNAIEFIKSRIGQRYMSEVDYISLNDAKEIAEAIVQFYEDEVEDSNNLMQ